jgi:DNA invertase Pin-like site-specific DNA recombinase
MVVWRLDRLGRSMQHLVSVITDLKSRGIGFKSLRDGAVDTTTASGELVFHIFSAVAQFEAQLIRERVCAGLAAARARGRIGGRKPVHKSDPLVKEVKRRARTRGANVTRICQELGISRTTFYRYLQL